MCSGYFSGYRSAYGSAYCSWYRSIDIAEGIALGGALGIAVHITEGIALGGAGAVQKSAGSETPAALHVWAAPRTPLCRALSALPLHCLCITVGSAQVSSPQTTLPNCLALSALPPQYGGLTTSSSSLQTTLLNFLTPSAHVTVVNCLAKCMDCMCRLN